MVCGDNQDIWIQFEQVRKSGINFLNGVNFSLEVAIQDSASNN